MFKGLRFFLAVLLVLLIAVVQACQPGHDDVPIPVAVSALVEQQAERGEIASPPQSRTDANSGLPTVALAALPPEARETLRDIKRGGPFAYERDGVVFGNRERLLPNHPRGYYHEYTVKTPGVGTRGARRIISGAPSEFYYTADHYQSFKSIRE